MFFFGYIAVLATIATRALAFNVALFTNGAFVSTSSETPNTRAALQANGHTVSDFTGFTATDFMAAHAANDVIVIPEMENGNLNAALDAAGRAALASGPVLVHGTNFVDNGASDLLNGVWTLGVGGNGEFANSGTSSKQPGAPGAFAAAPASVINRSGVLPLASSGTMTVVYSNDANGEAVVATSSATGRVVFFAYDFFDGSFADWLGVQQAALEFLVSTTAGGDPHLKGLFGIKFDVFGKPNANYSLLVTPAFEVNMQVAQFGPAKRYMTHMSVLYRGTSIAFDGWALRARKAELIKHFDALNATIKIDSWVMTIDLCPQHQLKFVAMHSGNINFLDLDVHVPGCHNAYGGLLGQTYQCKYATKKFQWSRVMEESFRVPTLTAPSGTYSPDAECAHEDEYAGAAIQGTTKSTGTATTMVQLR